MVLYRTQEIGLGIDDFNFFLVFDWIFSDPKNNNNNNLQMFLLAPRHTQYCDKKTKRRFEKIFFYF